MWKPYKQKLVIQEEMRTAKMRRTTVDLMVALMVLFVAFGCGKDDSGRKASDKRNGIKATGVMTKFEYGDGINAAIGIPSGAKVYRTRNRESTGEPVLVASDASLVDEHIGEEEMRVIRVNLSLRNIHGQEIASMVAFYRPFATDSYVVKTTLQSRFESIYTWGDIPGHSLVSVVTTDVTSGEKVLETKDLEFIKDSQGLFRGTEHHFAKGKTVCISASVRHNGTGLLVDERIIQGSLPMDYHTYEFVLSGWPSGRSPGFGGGFGF